MFWYSRISLYAVFPYPFNAGIVIARVSHQRLNVNQRFWRNSRFFSKYLICIYLIIADTLLQQRYSNLMIQQLKQIFITRYNRNFRFPENRAESVPIQSSAS